MATPQTSSALTPIPGAIIVGASAGIGEALAWQLARAGYAVALLARRADRLNDLAARINAELGARRAFPYPHDVTQYAEVPGLFQTILRDLGRVEIVVYNSGVLEPLGPMEFDFEKDRRMIEVNLLGAMAWLDQAAVLFDRLGSGHIVGISSIAGERGRVGNPAYNTSKAALNHFLESLRNRLTRKGVHVLTVRPGFVATEMLKTVRRPFWVASPERAAADIARAIHARRQVVYIPARWRLVALVLRHIPSVVFRRLSF